MRWARGPGEIPALGLVELDERLFDPGGRLASGHQHEPDDALVAQRQAQREIALVGHLAALPPAGHLTRPRNDNALDVLEPGLGLFLGELLIADRLSKHVAASGDAAKAPARRHRFDVGIEELLRRVQVVRDHCLDERPSAIELHRAKVSPVTTTFKARVRPSSGPRPHQRLGQDVARIWIGGLRAFG